LASGSLTRPPKLLVNQGMIFGMSHMASAVAAANSTSQTF
jgi:hypothetical protein